jgi:hypothetical protein
MRRSIDARFTGMNGVHGAKHGNAEEGEASKIQGGG